MKMIFNKRVGIYLLGIVVLACGITLNTKTNLGVSPIISVAYCATEIGGVSLGITTFLWYMVMIGMQAILLRRDFKIWQLLQVGVSFLTSWFIGIFDEILPMAQTMGARVGVLMLAILVTALGMILTVGMKIVPNPADGLANVLGQKMGKDLGFGKNLFDFTSIVISVTVGFSLVGRLVGIGLGTVVTMVLTGRVVAVINRFAEGFCRKIVEESD